MLKYAGLGVTAGLKLELCFFTRSLQYRLLLISIDYGFKFYFYIKLIIIDSNIASGPTRISIKQRLDISLIFDFNHFYMCNLKLYWSSLNLIGRYVKITVIFVDILNTIWTFQPFLLYRHFARTWPNIFQVQLMATEDILHFKMWTQNSISQTTCQMSPTTRTTNIVDAQ